MEKINVITLCSGYDSQCLALDRLKQNYPDFDYELIAWAEFDPESKQPVEKQPAVIAHNAIYPQWADRNLGDITKVDWNLIKEPIDLLCYSTPCQSISNAGLQHGFKKGSGTRSSIIWSVLDAIEVLRPKILLMENVAAMVSSKFINDYHSWCSAVSSYGYTNFAQVLNAKDYGIPQNRERIFLVSIHGDAWYNFPQPFKLEKRLKDVLETNVDEKYYLSEKTIAMFDAHRDKQQALGRGFGWKPTDGGGIAMGIKTSANTRADDNFIKEQCDTSFFNTQEE